MSRRKAVSDVYTEWDAIAFPNGQWSPDQDVQAWQRLWDRCFFDGRWTVPLDEAALVVQMGLALKIEEGRPHEAVELGNAFLAHPDIKRRSPYDLAGLLASLATAELLADHISSGVQTLRLVLDTPGHGKLSHRRTVLGALMRYSEVARPGAVAVGIPGLVRDLFYHWPGKRRLSKEAEGINTVGNLRTMLEAVS